MPKYIFSGLLPVLLLFPLGLEAEIITLISGHEITGDILEDEEGNLHVLLPNGGIQVFDKGDILRVIDPKNPPPIPRKQRELEKLFIDRVVLPLMEDQPQPDTDQEWKWKPLVQSTVLPGWGQRTLGHTAWGYGLTASSLALGGDYFSSRSLWAEAQTIYSDLTIPAILSQRGQDGFLVNYVVLGQKRERLLALENQTNNTVFALLALWAFNLVDVYRMIELKYADLEKQEEMAKEPSAYRIQFLAIPTGTHDPGFVFSFHARF